MERYKIRQAELKDTDFIVDIWIDGNIEQYSSQSLGTTTNEDLKRIISNHITIQDDNFKFWVCITDEDEIIGWQSILPFHASPNPLVRNCFAQSSTYVKKEFQTKGVGKFLLQHALNYCSDNTEIVYVIGLVVTENLKSLKMCDKLGFLNYGTLPKNKLNHNFPNFDMVIYET
ncbi:MAG TPA: GNAT family N-acetyltransferase [Ferruginibacter sp.]|jgi:L-amino acid N-acyltransferase YncA|nr:GNAT family N-acetyltransferase [Ferruginibacter sp.]